MDVNSKQTIVLQLSEDEAIRLKELCRSITEDDVTSDVYDFVEELKNNLNCLVND